MYNEVKDEDQVTSLTVAACPQKWVLTLAQSKAMLTPHVVAACEYGLSNFQDQIKTIQIFGAQ
jgi:hypothetical protein